MYSRRFSGLYSITVRVTLWYALVLSLVLAATGTAGFLLLKQALLEQAAARVQARAMEVGQLVEGVRNPGREDVEKVGLHSRTLVFSRGPGGLLVQISGPTGQSVNRSPGLTHALPLPPHPDRPADNVLAYGAGRIAWASRPLYNRGQLVGSVQVAAPLSQLYAQLRLMERGLLEAYGLGLLLALLGGYLIARRALTPVRAMTRAVESVAIDRLDRRLPLAGPPDELHRLAAAFNHMLDRLAQGVDAQRQFVAAASHELRTPLSVIQGYMGILARWGKEDPQIREDAVDIIQSELGRTRRMVNNLLLLAREDAGHAPGVTRLDLTALVREVCQEAHALREEVELTAEGLVALEVSGDAERLRQAILAVLDNALKYTPAGGKVTVSLRREGSLAALTIADTGIGIPPEALPHIFDRFYRADPARSRRTEGFGLGLSIARLQVERHGGQIAVRSEPGHGSTFTIHLPLAPDRSFAAKA
jgi:heavy metal sensor kinase